MKNKDIFDIINENDDSLDLIVNHYEWYYDNLKLTKDSSESLKDKQELDPLDLMGVMLRNNDKRSKFVLSNYRLTIEMLDKILNNKYFSKFFNNKDVKTLLDKIYKYKFLKEKLYYYVTNKENGDIYYLPVIVQDGGYETLISELLGKDKIYDMVISVTEREMNLIRDDISKYFEIEIFLRFLEEDFIYDNK